MAFIVRCQNLEELIRKWNLILAAHVAELPNGRFEQKPSQIRQLVQDLAQHPRIQSFYYTDNRDGIALRLYDNPFKNTYPQHYQEAPKNDGEEWAILRGKDLGSGSGPCKRAMLNAFDSFETSRLSGKTAERIEHFEHPTRNNATGATMPPPFSVSVPSVNTESPLVSAILSLRQFRQIILYGPPGTGKTRLARHAALAILAESAHIAVPSSSEDGPSEGRVREQLSILRKQGAFDLVVFHPAYEYEQFVGGIAPQASGNSITYKIEAGIFLKMAQFVDRENRPAVLMIDEINRGNLPKLLGELLYALEYRDEEVRLPFEWEGKAHLVVPKDLYIIATMNSSDRSIGHIDVAVRRRFGLLHIEPDPRIVRNFWKSVDAEFGDRLAELMIRLNKELHLEDPGGEHLVGHAYFLPDPSLPESRNQVERKWAQQVQQLLAEYGQLLSLDDSFFQKFPKNLNQALSGVSETT